MLSFVVLFFLLVNPPSLTWIVVALVCIYKGRPTLFFFVCLFLFYTFTALPQMLLPFLFHRLKKKTEQMAPLPKTFHLT